MPVIQRPDPADYMRQVAASGVGRAYKHAMLRALDVHPGHTVLELGCGPGADLPALASAVGAGGRVLAVDVDPAMADVARRTMRDEPVVQVVVGDAHHLALPEASVDRAHADRVFQHLGDPAQAMAQLRRVVAPGGLVAVVEPDWATLAIAAEDLAASQAFTDHTCARVVRNARIGRQLARLGTNAGFDLVSVTPFACLFQDLGEADAVLGLTRNTRAGVDAGQLDGPTSTAWLTDLATGPFVAVVTLVGVVLHART